jgi:hypothetical protein
MKPVTIHIPKEIYEVLYREQMKITPLIGAYNLHYITEKGTYVINCEPFEFFKELEQSPELRNILDKRAKEREKRELN